MSDAGDDLLNHIRSIVHGRVPPNLEETVTDMVGRTVVLIMSTPAFYNHLVIVQQLQRQNWDLRQALIAYQRADQERAQRALARRVAAARKAAPAKKATPRPAKRAAPKKAATSNARAFKRGAAGR